MAESAVDPPLAISMDESGNDSIQVKVIFSGVKKEDLDVSGKTMQIGRMKVSMRRFGSWIFETVGSETEVASLICKTGGPAPAFVYALHKAYPEISSWMSDASNCSFVLELEKEQKRRILTEIASGKMQENTQKVLSEITDLDFTIKMIIIAQEKKAHQPPSKETYRSEATSRKLESKDNSAEVAQNENGPAQPSTEKLFKYFKLKKEIATAEGDQEKLKKMAEFATCSMEIGKFGEDLDTVDEMKTLMRLVQTSQDDITAILEDISNVSKHLQDDDPVGSIDLLLASSNLIRQIKEQENRIASTNDILTKICDTVTRIFKVRSTTIDVTVGVDDELERPMTEDGSDASKQADKEQQRGKVAFRKHNYDDALRFYDSAIKLEPKKMVYHLDKAEVYLAKEDLEKCKNECNAVLQSNDSAKNKARAKEILGEVGLRSYNVLHALQQFDGSIKMSSSDDVLSKFRRLDQSVKQTMAVIQQQSMQLHAMQLQVRMPFAVRRR